MFGHFSAALDLKASVSWLFQELRVSNTSFASSKVMEGSLISAAALEAQLDVDSGDSNFRTFNAERVRRAHSLCLER